MTSQNRTEMWAVIKFCVCLGHTQTQTLKLMKNSENTKHISRTGVFKWYKRFNEGRSTLQADAGVLENELLMTP